MRSKHAIILGVFVLVALASGAHACGDKWLVSPHGHGEYGGFTSLRPTEILIYIGEQHGAADLELLDDTMAEALRGAGHRVKFVETSELAELAADPRYELVLFAFAHAEVVESTLMPLDRKPALLPLMSDESGDVEAAQDHFGWVVPCCSLAKLNQTIDELMIMWVRGEA